MIAKKHLQNHIHPEISSLDENTPSSSNCLPAKWINSNRSVDKMGKSPIDSFWYITGFWLQGCVLSYCRTFASNVWQLWNMHIFMQPCSRKPVIKQNESTVDLPILSTLLLLFIHFGSHKIDDDIKDRLSYELFKRAFF